MIKKPHNLYRNKINLIRAFSLVELSIVILVIGILTAAIVKGLTLYQKIGLASAQAITNNSTIHRIDGLKLWLETSLSSSFNESEIAQDERITVWFDNNSLIPKSQRYDLVSTAGPYFHERVYGNIPALYFDGVDSFFPIDGSIFVDTDYTVFIVASNPDNQEFSVINGGSGNERERLILTIGPTRLVQVHYGGNNNLLYSATNNVAIPTISTFYFKKNVGKKIWINSISSEPNAKDPSPTGALINFPNSTIAKNTAGNSFSKLYLAELIVFNKALKDKERISIINYLSQKYSIKLKN